ncbi:hypothetical protein Tco_0615560 [Tanacetum coccineum]
MEVNVDGMVIKSYSEEEMMADIAKTLEKLRAINLKLNPKKMLLRGRRNIFGPSHYEERHKSRPFQGNSEGRIAKWAIELGEYEIEFKGRNLIKGQILADFLTETPLTENRGTKNEEVKRKEPEPENAWKLFTDGASSFDGSGAGLMVVSPEGKEYTYALRFEFKPPTTRQNMKHSWRGCA